MLEVTIPADSLLDLAKRLRAAKNKATFQGNRADILRAFHAHMRRRFRSGGDGTWFGKTLVRSGALRDALTLPSSPRGVREVTPDTLTLGTSLPYARHLEAKGFTLIDADAAALVEPIMEAAIKKALEG